MKTYKIIIVSLFSSTYEDLAKKVEKVLNKKVQEGYEVVSVAFVQDLTKKALITLSKEEDNADGSEKS